jgi:hypothetical protein
MEYEIWSVVGGWQFLKLELTLPSLLSTLPRILGKRDPLGLAVVGGAPITAHNGADFRPWQMREHGNNRR